MQPKIKLYILLIFLLVQFWRFLMFLSFFSSNRLTLDLTIFDHDHGCRPTTPKDFKK